MLKGSLMINHSHLPCQVSILNAPDTSSPTLEPLIRLFAGDARPAFLFNPCVLIFQCDSCHARFMATPVLFEPSCPDCLGTLREVGTWDLRFQAWPQRQGGE
jgi:hypothetical protein